MAIITNLSLGGGLSAVLTTANVSPAVNSTMYECTSTGGFTITLPPVPAGGAVIGVMDAAGTCSATNFIRITPATGQSIDNLAVNDSYLVDYANANVVAYAAAGTTNWRLQKQATTMVQGGQLPAVTTATTIASGFVGEIATQTQTSSVTLVAGTAVSTTSKTIQPGNYILIGTISVNVSSNAGAINCSIAGSSGKSLFNLGGIAATTGNAKATFIQPVSLSVATALSFNVYCSASVTGTISGTGDDTTFTVVRIG